MRKIWDFHGGIHPAENKAQSTSQGLQICPCPAELILPLTQHLGVPAKPVVQVGEKVLKGQMIAKPGGPVSAAVHAPTSGTITAIEPREVPHPSGLAADCIVLSADGHDQWCELSVDDDYLNATPEEILNRVRSAGIAGMGGAGFPTAVKLKPPKEDKINTLILNAAECEPYITADDILLRTFASEVIAGLEILANLLQPEECLIGIEDNKPEAIAALREAVKDTRVEVVVIPTKYPSGGEKQLIKILTGKEVPHGRLPADIGVTCQNVGTAQAVYRAVAKGEPLISRITTVTGEGVSNPANYQVLLGTPIEFLLERAGYQPDRTGRLLMGGPMMGFALQSTALPIVKTTNCLLAASLEEFPAPPPEQACIRCGLCEEVCPAELLPQQLYWFSKSHEFEKAEAYNLFDCIECGACSYECPSSIPLVQYYRYSKSQVRAARADQAKSEKARERFEFRQARLIREQEEKDAKRKARAEAAAKAQAEKKAREAAASQQPETTSDDPRKAAVAEAVARAKAKRTSAPEAAPSSTAEELQQQVADLEKQVRGASEKIAKLSLQLEQAEAEQAPTAEKLKNAIAKNQDRLKQAEAKLEEARQSLAAASAGAAVKPEEPASPAAETPKSVKNPEQIRRSIQRLQEKVATLQHVITECEDSDPERAKELQASLLKTRQKITALETELPAGETANGPDVAQLEKQVLGAENKLKMMKNLLQDAEQETPVDPAKVAKFQRAVEKNEERLAAAQKALSQAVQPAPIEVDAAPVLAPQPPALERPATPASEMSIDELKAQVEKAENKLEASRDRLQEARAAEDTDPVMLGKLERAFAKNEERLALARQRLQAVKGDDASAASQPTTPEAPESN